MLTGYAVVILTFMGAVHWGLAMRMDGAPAARQYSFSVLPALLAWLALAMPQVWGISCLIAGFVALCVYDGAAAARGDAPAWYPRLRLPLTTVVVLCLIAAALALLHMEEPRARETLERFAKDRDLRVRRIARSASGGAPPPRELAGAEHEDSEPEASGEPSPEDA